MILRALALLLALSSAALAQSGQIPTATVWGNSTASKAIASPATLTAMFDRAFGSTGGSLIARTGAAWGLVSGTATARLPLLSGASTTPVWGAYTLPASVTSGGVNCFTSTSVSASSVLLTASALVLGGGAAACPTPLGSLGTTTTLLHGNAAGAPSFSALVAADVTTNTLTNATLAQAAASTLKGNPTAGAANVQDFTITGLTSKATPAAADELLLSDSAASNVFKKATVTTLLSAGAVTSINGQSGALLVAGHPQGRLTLQSGVPVMTSTQSAKTTLIYTQYAGNQVPIYNGTNMVLEVITAGEISVATTDATKSPAAIGASKVNDWFVWNDAGTIRLGHGPDWTSDTARSAGTALVYATGVLVNSVAITNGAAQFKGTYVGTTRSNASSQLDWIIGGTANGGTAGFLGVWNMYNRVEALATSVDNTTYTYTSATIRQAHAAAGNQVSFVSGVAEDPVDARMVSRIDALAASNAFIGSGFGLDSITAYAAGAAQSFLLRAAVATSVSAIPNSAIFPPQIGLHYIARLENGDGTNANNANAGSIDFLTVSLRM